MSAADASAAALCSVGVFMLVRADQILQTVLDFVPLLAGISVAAATRTAGIRRGL